MPTRRNQDVSVPPSAARRGGPPIVQPVGGPFRLCRLVEAMNVECPSQHLSNPLMAPLSLGASGVERYRAPESGGRIYALYLAAPIAGSEQISAAGAVYLFGRWGVEQERPDLDIDTTKHNLIQRLDDFGTGGITFSFVDSAGAAEDVPTDVVPRDSTYFYSLNALAEPIDLKGCHDILTVVKTRPDIAAAQGESVRYAELWALIGPS